MCLCVCVCVCVRARARVCSAHARSTAHAHEQTPSMRVSLIRHLRISLSISPHTQVIAHTPTHSCTNLTQDAAREDAKVQTLQPLSSKGKKERRANAATQEERKCFSFEKSKKSAQACACACAAARRHAALRKQSGYAPRGVERFQLCCSMLMTNVDIEWRHRHTRAELKPTSHACIGCSCILCMHACMLWSPTGIV
jgi:hypothetical protein